MAEYKILLENENASAIEAAVRQGLRDADPLEIAPRQLNYRPLYLALRDSSGEIIGGLYGMIMWSWLMIDGLWFAGNHRSQGLGSQLLSAAEEQAIKQGCRGAWLGTFDFQGREFYERHGYTIFAELNDFPPEHKHFHLQKLFAKSAY